MLQSGIDYYADGEFYRMDKNVFEKNINALRQKGAEGEKLADKLKTYILTDVPQLVKENNAYNFLYKGKYLHNPRSPLLEAGQIFAMAENSPVTIHLLYGIGLGYLFQVTAAKSQGTVILYEPDLNILYTAFSLVNFENDILRGNVYITDSFDEVTEYIYRKSNMKNTPLLLSTTAYQDIDPEKFNNMVTELQRAIGRFSLDLKYTKEKFFSLLIKTIENIPKLIHEIPIGEFKNYFEGKTAVVVSAGPTLDRNIETIKKYRDNIILIVVGTAMKAIAHHNITPDFLCIIEANDCSRQIKGLEEKLKDVNFITEPFSNPNLRKFQYKNTYSHISNNFPVNTFWCDTAGITNKEYSSKGTVSYTALNVARILGCKKIILVGQDLAYIEGQCYSKDSAYKDLVCQYNETSKKWEIVAKDFENFCTSLGNYDNPEIRKRKAIERINSLNNSLYYVKGIKGDMIPTESVYAAFIQPLTEYTQTYPDREYINTSLVGAQIDGFKNMPLEDALKDSEPTGSRELKSDFCYDIEFIKDNLFKQKESLKPALFIIDELKKIGGNLVNDINRYNNVSQEILKTLKRLSTGYTALGYDFTKANPLFDFMTVAERIDIDYEMKMTREFTVESVLNIANRITAFAEKAEQKINAVNQTIERILEEI